jgi:hypothetical protein
MKDEHAEVLHSVARGLESTRDFWWRQSGSNPHHSTTTRWARAKIVTHSDHRIRVQLGDGSRYTITIEEDEL